MGIGRRIGLDDEKGVAVAVFIALVIVGCVFAGYYVWLRPPAEEYNTIYLLDNQKQANNFPETMVSNQNSTFSVYVDVTNHMNVDQKYQVQTKITKNFMVSSQGVAGDPVNTYDFPLKSGETYEQSVTLTENNVGSYTVVFELWRLDGSAYVFTQDYCVLPIKVIN